MSWKYVIYQGQLAYNRYTASRVCSREQAIICQQRQMRVILLFFTQSPLDFINPLPGFALVLFFFLSFLWSWCCCLGLVSSSYSRLSSSTHPRARAHTHIRTGVRMLSQSMSSPWRRCGIVKSEGVRIYFIFSILQSLSPLLCPSQLLSSCPRGCLSWQSLTQGDTQSNSSGQIAYMMADHEKGENFDSSQDAVWPCLAWSGSSTLSLFLSRPSTSDVMR